MIALHTFYIAMIELHTQCMIVFHTFYNAWLHSILSTLHDCIPPYLLQCMIIDCIPNLLNIAFHNFYIAWLNYIPSIFHDCFPYLLHCMIAFHTFYIALLHFSIPSILQDCIPYLQYCIIAFHTFNFAWLHSITFTFHGCIPYLNLIHYNSWLQFIPCTFHEKFADKVFPMLLAPKQPI